MHTYAPAQPLCAPTVASTFRLDIQALRGVAVLVVVLYHARLDFLPAGYLGVDIFFVLSGYLITRLIAASMARGDFSFGRFYLRRAQRLLPAAYVTFLATTLLVPFFLTSTEIHEFRQQMLGALSFTANVVLWRQSGYFEGIADLKPLLHTWSLAIEEQYYFMLPLLLTWVPRRWWLSGMIAMIGLSLLLCLQQVSARPDAVFYLLPTRMWELGLGSLGALLVMTARWQRLLELLFWPALVTVLSLPFLHLGLPHPGPGALLICLATLVLLLRQHPLFQQGVWVTAFSKLGNLSYALYLVHWPLFALLNNVWIGNPDAPHPPLGLRLSVLALALCLAWLLHRFVEEPMRHHGLTQPMRAAQRMLAVSGGLVLLALLWTQLMTPERNFAEVRRPNQGFDAACESTGAFEGAALCRNSDTPEIMVWGDSFAMHLIPGLLASETQTPQLVQATRSVCGPLLGLATISGSYDAAWAARCIDFNDSVLAYLAATPSVHTVVLSSPFGQFLGNGHFLLKRHAAHGELHQVAAGLPEAVPGLKRTVDAIRALGKRVVVVAPPPHAGFDAGRCIERLQAGLAVMGAHPDCSINRASFEREQNEVLEFLAQLPQQADIATIDFRAYLCNAQQCKTHLGDTFIYRDDGHFSHEGSVLMATQYDLHHKIRQLAR